MDVLFRLGEGSVSDVLEQIDEPPGYSSIRRTLSILEDKGLVVHRRVAAKYVYRPRRSAKVTGPTVLKRLVGTFFGGSRPRAIAALLDSTTKLSEQEYRELTALLKKARSARKK